MRNFLLRYGLNSVHALVFEFGYYSTIQLLETISRYVNTLDADCKVSSDVSRYKTLAVAMHRQNSR